MANILYIEDEAFFATLMAQKLNSMNYHVSLAQNGDEGLKIALSQPFDLILLDLMLPGKNGLEVLRGIRDNPTTRSVPVIVVSNVDSEQDHKQAEALGIQGYLVKMLTTPSEVAEHIATTLSNGPARG